MMILSLHFAFLLLKGQNQQHILIVNICIPIGRGRHLEDKAVDSAGSAALAELMEETLCLLINELNRHAQ